MDRERCTTILPKRGSLEVFCSSRTIFSKLICACVTNYYNRIVDLPIYIQSNENAGFYCCFSTLFSSLGQMNLSKTLVSHMT